MEIKILKIHLPLNDRRTVVVKSR